MTLELFLAMPWDCYGVVTGGRDMGWFEDENFHKTATPVPKKMVTPGASAPTSAPVRRTKEPAGSLG
jgi:hypothetical protein